MAPNSRPPLTARIKASFEGRRRSYDGGRKINNRSSLPPSTHGNETAVLPPTSPISPSHAQEAESVPNQESVHTAGAVLPPSSPRSPLHAKDAPIAPNQESIHSAVDAAINGEAFQNAIAANLAKLIKPSIKSALDTIQPVVEAVYSHEMLLRKTSQSVDDVLTRMDTAADKEDAKSQKESFVDPCYIPPGEAAERGRSSDGVHVSRGGDSVVEQVRSLLEEHTANIGQKLMGLEAMVESISEKNEELSQGVLDLKSSLPTTETIDFLKASSEQANASSSELQACLDQLKAENASILESIGLDLGKQVQIISEKSQDHPVLATHTTQLDSISTDLIALKSMAESNSTEKIDSVHAEVISLRSHVETYNADSSENLTNILTAVAGQAAILSELKEIPAHPELLSALEKSNDSHAAHTAALAEIKERSLGPAPAADAVADTPPASTPADVIALLELKRELEALKENVLAELTSNNDNITSVGGKIDALVEGPSTEVMAMVKLNHESQEKHATVLEEIKGLHGQHAVALEGLKSLVSEPAQVAEVGDLKENITSIVSKLDQHSGALKEIKVLHGSHSEALESIKSLPTAPVPVADHSDINAQVSGLASKLDEQSAALEELKGLSAAQSVALVDIKSAEPVSERGDLGEIGDKISALASKLTEHSAAFNELKGLHGMHSKALEDIKISKPEDAPANDSDLGDQIISLTAKFDEHFATLEELKKLHGAHSAAFDKVNDLHASHSAAFDDLRGFHGSHSASLEEISKSLKEPTPTGGSDSAISTQVAAIAAKLDEHADMLGEIKDSGRSLHEIKSHGDLHATTLTDLKDLYASLSEEIAGLKILVAEASPATSPNDLGPQIADVVGHLEAHGALLEELKSLHASHAVALQSHGTAIDSVKSLSAAPTEGDGSGSLEPKITEIAEKLNANALLLDEIKATGGSHTSILDSLKIFHDSHSSKLDEIRSHCSATSADTSANASAPIADVETLLKTVIETLTQHTSLLTEIKEDVSAEILTALHDMGQVQSQSTTLLTEIKEADVNSEILTLLHADGEAHTSSANVLSKIQSLVEALDERHSSVVTKLDGHHGVLSAIKDAQDSHKSSFDEVKVKFTEPAPAGTEDLEAHFTDITSKLVEHSTKLDALQDLHVSHTASLNEIKSRSLEPSSTGTPFVDLSGLEAHLTAIISTLESQTTTLSSISEAVGIANPDIIAAIAQSHALLETHGTLLEAIKESSAKTDLLSKVDELKVIFKEQKTQHGAALTDLHTETKDSHSSLIAAIGGLAVGGAAGAGAAALLSDDDDKDQSSKKMLEEVKAIKSLVESSAANSETTKETIESIKSQIDVNHGAITTNIDTLAGSLKTEIESTGTNILESISSFDKTVDLSSFTTHLDQHSQDLEAISTRLETIDHSMKENFGYITGMEGTRNKVLDQGIVEKANTPELLAEAAIPEQHQDHDAESETAEPQLSIAEYHVVSKDAEEPVADLDASSEAAHEDLKDGNAGNESVANGADEPESSKGLDEPEVSSEEPVNEPVDEQLRIKEVCEADSIPEVLDSPTIAPIIEEEVQETVDKSEFLNASITVPITDEGIQDPHERPEFLDSPIIAPIIEEEIREAEEIPEVLDSSIVVPIVDEGIQDAYERPEILGSPAALIVEKDRTLVEQELDDGKLNRERLEEPTPMDDSRVSEQSLDTKEILGEPAMGQVTQSGLDKTSEKNAEFLSKTPGDLNEAVSVAEPDISVQGSGDILIEHPLPDMEESQSYVQEHFGTDDISALELPRAEIPADQPEAEVDDLSFEQPLPVQHERPVFGNDFWPSESEIFVSGQTHNVDVAYDDYISEQGHDEPDFPDINQRLPLRPLEAEEVRYRDLQTLAAGGGMPDSHHVLQSHLIPDDGENDENDFRPRDLDEYPYASSYANVGHLVPTNALPASDQDADYSSEDEPEESLQNPRVPQFSEYEDQPRILQTHEQQAPAMSPFQTLQLDTSISHAGLPAHLQMNGPSITPIFTDLRERSPVHPDHDEADNISPSSEFAVPMTPRQEQNPPLQSQPRDLSVEPALDRRNESTKSSLPPAWHEEKEKQEDGR